MSSTTDKLKFGFDRRKSEGQEKLHRTVGNIRLKYINMSTGLDNNHCMAGLHFN